MVTLAGSGSNTTVRGPVSLGRAAARVGRRSGARAGAFSGTTTGGVTGAVRGDTGGVVFAWITGRRFENAVERLGFNKGRLKLRTDLFTPPAQETGQLALF